MDRAIVLTVLAVLLFGLSRQQLELAPRFAKAVLKDSQWAESVYRYFGLQPSWGESGEVSKSSSVKPLEEPKAEEKSSESPYDFDYMWR